MFVMIRSKSVSICNRSRARLVDSNRNRTFSRAYPNLMHSYGWLLEPRGSKLALLKSKFNVDNFIRRLSWSILSDFDTVHSWYVCGRLKWQKNSLKTQFWGSRSFKVIDVGTFWQLASSACYDTQQVCLSATVILRDWTTVAETARFEGDTHIWCICTECFLNLGGRNLHRWNQRLMPNISYAGCPGLSWMVSAQCAIKMCITA